MRLLKVDSLVFQEFFEPDEEEILFEDIQNLEKAKQKLGYQKVNMACKLAESQGYKYIWIDTCCINKSSSAELTEAINSMYRWYKESDVCYAFLSDVSEHSLSSSNREELSKSPWFTRGWTLQELLAPSNVQTKIDQNTLRGKDILDVSVARRMYWASKRQTTRIEDLAYSLLGIFDINMPLIYVEGHKAFRRLQEEILRTTDDQSIFAWYNYTMDGFPVDVLAHAPSDFARSGSVSPYASFRVNRKATSITNQGIAVQLPILSIPSPRHTEYSPFEEIEAILDCQLGSAPGTFPTIRLRSVERGSNAQRQYYRIMGIVTKVKNSDTVELLTGNVVGFDPTQLDRDIYKSAIDKLTWSCKVETIIITRHIPRPYQDDSIHIPWSLSLLASENPPDNTPFWLALYGSPHFSLCVRDAYPKERWDESLRQMRVSPLPKEVFEKGFVCRIDGIITLELELLMGKSASPLVSNQIPRIEENLIPGYMDTFNEDILEQPASSGEKFSASASCAFRHSFLRAKARVMEVSGGFYYIINVFALGSLNEYVGLRLLD
ncbi:HET-domain-containing protein [Xylaria arbuscula]|nr:HET-domain-containing protein [Xylaria arbuscula]